MIRSIQRPIQREPLVAVALGAALLVSSPVRAGMAQMNEEAGVVGEPGPTAIGVAVSLNQLPPVAEGATEQQGGEIPRLYPVDAATFEQMKAQANAAAAAATATAEDER